MAAYRKAHPDQPVPPVSPHVNEAKAWLAFAQGNDAAAFELLRAAIAYQDKVGKGEVDLPAREMYADMLMELGRPAEALEQYLLSLKTDPNRFNGLYGAGYAAESLGRKDAAAVYFHQLADNCTPAAGPVRAELQHARAFLALAAVALVGASSAQDRLPTIPPASYSEEQRQAAADFELARKTPVFGPFEPLMYSPTVMNDARALGDYLRFKPAIGTTLSELVILVTAREWSQDYEWSFHYPLALKAGIRAELADAIGEGRRPPAMNEDEEIVYDFTTQLHRAKGVSDPSFARAEKRFGKQGVVDLTAISGYYTLLAMELNVARYKVPEGGRTLPHLAN